MKIKLYDRSLYFKGLLVLAKKDKKLNDEEIKILINIGQKLDFDKKFIDETISTLLINKNITDEPLKFSSYAIAESFIKDGFKIAVSDNEIAPSELNYLKQTALINGISENSFQTLFKIYANMSSSDFSETPLEIENRVF